MGVLDPKFCGINASTPPVLQEGSYFTDTTYGLDSGRRTFLVHPGLSRTSWPQRGDADREYPNMYVSKVTPRRLESTLIELEVEYQGQSHSKSAQYTRGTDTRTFSYEASGTGGGSGDVVNTINVELPVPTLSLEYVAYSQPSQAGVGGSVAGLDYLYDPGPLGFTISSTKGLSKNLVTGWVLGSIHYETIIPGKVWLVRIEYHYNYTLA